MLEVKNHLGTVTFSESFFENIVKYCVSGSFGIVLPVGFTDSAAKIVRKTARVKVIKGRLLVAVHIAAVYGVNATSAVKTLQSNIARAIREETSVTPAKVNVFIDNIKY
jgi:uncharacterized alkaline shock family protein YloU